MAISKQKDKKFHVEGELTVAPFSLLNNVLRELKRAVDACGNRLVLYFPTPATTDSSVY